MPLAHCRRGRPNVRAQMSAPSCLEIRSPHPLAKLCTVRKAALLPERRSGGVLEAVSTVLGFAACCVSVCDASGNLPGRPLRTFRLIGECLGGAPRTNGVPGGPTPRPDVNRFNDAALEPCGSWSTAAAGEIPSQGRAARAPESSKNRKNTTKKLEFSRIFGIFENVRKIDFLVPKT